MFNKKPIHKHFHWAIAGLFLVGMIFAIGQNQNYLFTSIIPTQSHDPYDGTTLPILNAPKWASLTPDEWDKDYNSIPSSKMQALPVYDANVLNKSTATLGWSSEADLAIRNAKITFSVPYMGNYKLDGQENAGSHLAVDLKIPMYTPVYAIGNGTVVKAVNQSTGFGNHIVLKHNNFPSFSDESKNETLFSSYSHLNEIKVIEGDVVRKGELIGLSGETGTATTPHLHFQIDNSKAPWHPYWPFTYQEADAAGYSFSDAINEGLGKAKALETTVNPMMYVQKYMDGAVVVDDSADTTDPVVDPVITPDDTDDNTDPIDDADGIDTDNNELPPDIDDVEDAPVVVTRLNTFELVTADDFFVEQSSAISVTAFDENGTAISFYKPTQEISISVVVGEADVPSSLSASDFNSGIAKFYIKPTSAGDLQIQVSNGTISAKSKIANVAMFSDVSTSDSYFKAVSFLKDNDVIGGYPDGSFQPYKVVSRVEALKFILNGINSNLISTNSLPFSDTNAQEWYSEYVATGYGNQIVEGYPDNTFKPANTVNRAEFLKMLLSAMDIEPELVTRDVYDDVSMESWYAPYVKYAKDKNLIVISGGNFKPEGGMSRAEVAETMYRMIMVKLSGAKKYSSGIQIANGDIQAYFS